MRITLPFRITLLVPCYNAARFLPRLAASVAELTVGFDEVICYDDGSTDETLATARALGWRILGPNPNRGVAYARNQLVAAATTEWFHLHDADDLLAPRFIEELRAFCDDRHDVVSCDADWVEEVSRNTIISWRYDPAELKQNAAGYLLTHPMGLNNSVIRRVAWNKVGGCDESLTMWEDADVYFRLARDGARFHHIPEMLTLALRHEDSFSHDYRKSWNCRLTALERYASHPATQSLRPAHAAAAEQVARSLALLYDDAASRRAVALCRQFGGNPPTTQNPLLRFLRLIVPPPTLFRWQEKGRQHPA